MYEKWPNRVYNPQIVVDHKSKLENKYIRYMETKEKPDLF